MVQESKSTGLVPKTRRASIALERKKYQDDLKKVQESMRSLNVQINSMQARVADFNIEEKHLQIMTQTLTEVIGEMDRAKTSYDKDRLGEEQGG